MSDADGMDEESGKRDWWRRIIGRVSGDVLPSGFTGELVDDEYVLATASLREGGQLVATSVGLWVPDEGANRRVGWHLISKATWGGGALAVIEAEETEVVHDAVLLADRPVRRFRLARPGRLPEVVQRRVTDSIKSSHRRDLPGGGAWFIQRKVPGRGGIVLQVRAQQGTDPSAVRLIAAQVADEIRRLRQRG